jgi:hypothetical protein
MFLTLKVSLHGEWGHQVMVSGVFYDGIDWTLIMKSPQVGRNNDFSL